MAPFQVPKCTHCGKDDRIVLCTPLSPALPPEGWVQCDRCATRIGDYMTTALAGQMISQFINDENVDDIEDLKPVQVLKGAKR